MRLDGDQPAFIEGRGRLGCRFRAHAAAAAELHGADGGEGGQPRPDHRAAGGRRRSTSRATSRRSGSRARTSPSSRSRCRSSCPTSGCFPTGRSRRADSMRRRGTGRTPRPKRRGGAPDDRRIGGGAAARFVRDSGPRRIAADPAKNVREMLGRPMIAYTIEAALRSGAFARVVVTTDEPAIAEIARERGRRRSVSPRRRARRRPSRRSRSRRSTRSIASIPPARRIRPCAS